MKLIILLLLGLVLAGAGHSTQSVNDSVSIIQRADGQFDVLCKDHTRELVSQQDILSDNICPNIKSPHPSNKKDILFVIDNSGSMQSSQEKLALYANGVISDLRLKNYDYKIAVITTDAYTSIFTGDLNYSRFKSHGGVSVIDNNTPNQEMIFQELILQGTMGRGDERPYLSVMEAFENPHNTGFLRQDSFLNIVFIGDEDDFSHYSAQGIVDNRDPRLIPVYEVGQYLLDLTQSSPGNYKVTVTAIAIFDQRCLDSITDGWPGRKLGYRYSNLAYALAGKHISLCDIHAGKNIKLFD